MIYTCHRYVEGCSYLSMYVEYVSEFFRSLVNLFSLSLAFDKVGFQTFRMFLKAAELLLIHKVAHMLASKIQKTPDPAPYCLRAMLVFPARLRLCC